jgi:hypothetical protein
VNPTTPPKREDGVVVGIASEQPAMQVVERGLVFGEDDKALV